MEYSSFIEFGRTDSERNEEMYEIVYDNSSDRNSAKRFVVRGISAERLGEKIISLQSKGNVIYAVRQAN